MVQQSSNMDKEKYSLRQRSKRENNNFKVHTTKTLTKLTKDKKDPKNKPKTKAAPLSKYRRKTANARERTRMKEINSAFETLRKCLPISMQSGDICATNEKLTKITTLKMAMNYIEMLSDSTQDIEDDLKNNNEIDDEFQYTHTNFMNQEDYSSSDISYKFESDDDESLQSLESFINPIDISYQKPERQKHPTCIELELFLEADRKAFEISELCLSQLSPIDNLTHFGDLFNSEYSDNSTLELYI